MVDSLRLVDGLPHPRSPYYEIATVSEKVAQPLSNASQIIDRWRLAAGFPEPMSLGGPSTMILPYAEEYL